MPLMKYWNGSTWVELDAKDGDTVDGIHFRLNGNMIQYSTDEVTWKDAGAVGNATPDDVVAPKTFSSSSGVNQTGTINKQALVDAVNKAMTTSNKMFDDTKQDLVNAMNKINVPSNTSESFTQLANKVSALKLGDFKIGDTLLGVEKFSSTPSNIVETPIGTLLKTDTYTKSPLFLSDPYGGKYHYEYLIKDSSNVQIIKKDHNNATIWDVTIPYTTGSYININAKMCGDYIALNLRGYDTGYLWKINKNTGQVLWDKQHGNFGRRAFSNSGGGGGTDYSYSKIIIDESDNIYVAREAQNDYGTYYPFEKYNSSLTRLWQVSKDRFYDIDLLSDGTIIAMTGDNYLIAYGGYDYIRRYKADGTEITNKVYSSYQESFKVPILRSFVFDTVNMRFYTFLQESSTARYIEGYNIPANTGSFSSVFRVYSPDEGSVKYMENWTRNNAIFVYSHPQSKDVVLGFSYLLLKLSYTDGSEIRGKYTTTGESLIFNGIDDSVFIWHGNSKTKKKYNNRQIITLQ